jgi:hypothetical protein
MSDEIRKQIAKKANLWWTDNDGPDEDPDGFFEDAYIEGAIKFYSVGFSDGHRAGWNESVEAMIGMHRQLIDRAQSRIDEVLTVDNEIDADRAAILRAAITNSGEAIKKLEAMRKV